MKDYKTKLNEKQDYGTGATRDAAAGKGRFDLIPNEALVRLAGVYERGGLNHGDRNWEQGLPLSRMIDSAMRHIIQHKMSKYRGEFCDEDHLAHAVWNLLGIMHIEEMVEQGFLPEELDDLPRYETPNPQPQEDDEEDEEDSMQHTRFGLSDPIPAHCCSYYDKPLKEDDEVENEEDSIFANEKFVINSKVKKYKRKQFKPVITKEDFNFNDGVEEE